MNHTKIIPPPLRVCRSLESTRSQATLRVPGMGRRSQWRSLGIQVHSFDNQRVQIILNYYSFVWKPASSYPLFISCYFGWDVLALRHHTSIYSVLKNNISVFLMSVRVHILSERKKIAPDVKIVCARCKNKFEYNLSPHFCMSVRKII